MNAPIPIAWVEQIAFARSDGAPRTRFSSALIEVKYHLVQDTLSGTHRGCICRR